MEILSISDTPANTLHIFNEVTQQDRSIPLPAPPIAVAVDPSGLNAAVAYDAHVSWIDLQAATIRASSGRFPAAYEARCRFPLRFDRGFLLRTRPA